MMMMIMTMIAVLHARERSSIAKKIWWSIHPRKFGYDAAYDLPSVQTLGGGGGGESEVRQSGEG